MRAIHHVQGCRQSRRCATAGWLSRMVLAILCFVSTAATALTLAEYEHTFWGAKNGGDGAVIRVSETPGGMLLLKTSVGYQVFDGVEFHSVGHGNPPPFGDYAEALGQRSPTGAIYYFDPITDRLMRKWNDRIEPVEDRNNVTYWRERFVFDLDGIGWLTATNNLYRLDGLKVELVSGAWGIPADTPLDNLVLDKRGTIWVGAWEESASGAGGLYFLPRGARKFERFAQPIECLPMALAPDGSLWCANDTGVRVVTVVDGRPAGWRQLPGVPASGYLFFDSHGGFWMATPTGIAHATDWRQVLASGGAALLQADAMTPKEGLSSDSIWEMTEDSAGSVWIATGAGLDRFRTTRFTQVKLPRRGFGSALVPDADGGLWAGNWDGTLMHISEGRIEDIPGVFHINAIRSDNIGRVWVAGEDAIWCKSPGGPFTPLEGRPNFSMPHTHQIAQDDSGAMWFQSARQLLRLQDGHWSKPQGPGVPASDMFYYLIADQQRQLWFAGDKRGPFVLKSGAFRELKPPTYASAIQRALSGFARGQRVWLGGSNGVGVFIGDEFHPLKLKDDVAKSITGIVETPEGDLWLHGLRKAFRVPADQVDAGVKGQVATAEVFDFRDGLTAATGPTDPRPTLVQDVAGRLWFATNQGLFWADPKAPQPRAAKPSATLLWAVRSDGQRVPLGAGAIRLPANPGRTEFDYAAAALGVSDRVQYRYRVDDVDRDWQDAGTRRTAYYTHLPPGKHRFEVIASNEQGQWATRPASLDFEVQAAWYQTNWFRALMLALILGLLWMAYLLRVGVVAARERSRMREVAAERERIARDLHDTLLQSMQGVILGFQSLATGLPEEDPTRKTIESRLDHADQLLGEARDRVRDLRTTGAGALPLREAFQLAAAELADTMRVEVVEEGRPRALLPLARDAIYLVGREALLNAALHGGANLARVHLQFESRQFCLRVRDDGVGIPAEILTSGARPGHFGLVGMKERAEQLAAEFVVSRPAGGGTEVVLTVPGARAFEPASAPDLGLDLLRRAWQLILPKPPAALRKG